MSMTEEFALDQTTLRQEADRCGFLIGNAAWESGTDGHEPAYKETLRREFNLVVTRAQLTPGIVHPERDRFDFTEADKVFAFAQTNGMKVRGHHLFGSSENAAMLPTWIKVGDHSRDQLLAIMREHLRTVIGHYKGQVIAWDIFNETMADGPTPDHNGLRDNFWWQKIGPDYLEWAFRYALEADPQGRFCLNEYGVEQGPADGGKGQRFFDVVKSLRDKEIAVHAVGFQSYFDLGTSPAQVADALRRFAEIGVEVHITEMAVLVHTKNPSEDQLARQAEMYRSILKVCLDSQNCRVLTIFGVTDKLHWLVVQGVEEAPVLFDHDYRPKPAYFAMKQGFAR